MPLRANPITRPSVQHLREASALRSPRDSDDISRMHYKLDQLAKQVAALTDALKRTQQELDRLRLRKGGEVATGLQNPCPEG